ncbi:MFS transporter [Acidiplasma sp.]|uniref:MFS transporter n=1 Tax=Acidiplasma sp. TaxID=1872114 RepID=UPI00258FFED4|nr:MFS transporter [Acidiplasma sp.]
MVTTAREIGIKSRIGLLTIFIAGALPAIIVDFDGSAYSFAAPFIISAVKLPIYYLGILVSGYAAGIAIFSVVGGFLFDRLSPKLTVISSILIFSVFTISTGYSTTAIEVLISRLIVGFGVGMFQSSSIGILGDTNPEFRGTGVMLWGVLAGVGTTAAPYIFLPFLPAYHIPFLISGILGFIVALIFYIIIPPVFKKEEKAKNPIKMAINRYTIYPLIAMFFFGFTLLNILGYYSEYLIKIVSFSSSEAAVLISMLGVGGIIFGLPAGFASDKIGRKPILILGIILIFISMVFITYSPKNYILFIILTIMFGTGWSIYSILSPTAGQDMVKDEAVGSASGAILMSFNIGGIIGPLLLASYINIKTFRTGMLYFMIIPAAIALLITVFIKFPGKTSEIVKEQIEEGL